jgi:hypothetical protein
VRRLRDDQRRSDPHDSGGLAQDHLDASCVLPLRDLDRFGRGLDGTELDDPALGLRDDLLREDDDVPVFELDFRGDELREVLAGLDLGQSRDRDDPQLAAQGSPVSRMPACAL